MPKMPKVMEIPTHIWFQISNVENPTLRGTEIKQHEKVERPFILRKPLLPRFSGAFWGLSFLFYTGITQNNKQNNSVQLHSTIRG
jgi:hypothetical protein